ncbi:MAG: hypothetical protein LBE86_12245 [Gemmobacter sp.]|jgi:hypothetical protein|nr:hypothetical protein [Gemmobacter sp.]
MTIVPLRGKRARLPCLGPLSRLAGNAGSSGLYRGGENSWATASGPSLAPQWNSHRRDDLSRPGND